METKQDRLITKLKNELGFIILEALNDPEVIEIMLNPTGAVWVEKLGQPMCIYTELTPVNALSLIGTVADALSTTITRQNPILEGELPLNGERFEALIPPVVSAPVFTIRKKAHRIFSLNDYVKQGALTEKQAGILIEATSSHHNILVVGGTGSGKTTLTNALIHSIYTHCPDDRLIIIEDTAELQVHSPNAVALRTSQHVDMLGLLRATLRLRPDRIVVGEVRGGEAMALLKSWNTGHSGGVATVHANSAKAGLMRLEQLAYESTQSIHSIPPLIAETINYIVFIEKRQRQRVVSEILAVKGYQNNEYHTQSL